MVTSLLESEEKTTDMVETLSCELSYPEQTSTEMPENTSHQLPITKFLAGGHIATHFTFCLKLLNMVWLKKELYNMFWSLIHITQNKIVILVSNITFKTLTYAGHIFNLVSLGVMKI